MFCDTIVIQYYNITCVQYNNITLIFFHIILDSHSAVWVHSLLWRELTYRADAWVRSAPVWCPPQHGRAVARPGEDSLDALVVVWRLIDVVCGAVLDNKESTRISKLKPRFASLDLYKIRNILIFQRGLELMSYVTTRPIQWCNYLTQWTMANPTFIINALRCDSGFS